MKKYLRYISSKWYLLKLKFRYYFSNTNAKIRSEKINLILEEYKSKKKIVVVCNGPSANRLSLDDDSLYLVTNSGNKIVEGKKFLYYVNDPFYVQKILAAPSYLKDKNQKIIFYYGDTRLHKKGLNFIKKHKANLKQRETFFISPIDSKDTSLENYLLLKTFLEERELPFKVQNSGMFLLIFGFFLAKRMHLPLEIFGLDLGVGGKIHYNGKGLIGTSVYEERIKKNMELYLHAIYNDLGRKVKNFSNFYTKIC